MDGHCLYHNDKELNSNIWLWGLYTSFRLQNFMYVANFPPKNLFSTAPLRFLSFSVLFAVTLVDSSGEDCLDIAVKNTENIRHCLLQGQDYLNFSQKMSREIPSVMRRLLFCSGKRCCRNPTRSREQAVNCMDRVARIVSRGQFAEVWSFFMCG